MSEVTSGSGSDQVERDDAIRAFLEQHRPEIESQLAEWVAIPSISAVADRAIDVQRSARWLVGAFRDAGLETEIVPTGDAAAVIARLHTDDDLPTVLVYSHHDVRHAKPEEWQETAPFDPVVRGGRLYGRGASDAKGQAVAHLWGLRAHLASRAHGRPAVNLVYLVEGEEEIASPHLADLLTARADEFACDAIVFSDTLQWAEDFPGVVTSMRGILGADLRVIGPAHDQHSGAVSGAAPNPVHALVEVMAALHDESGRVALPGFYDDVAPLTARRAAELAALPFDEASWVERTGTRSIDGEAAHTVPERLWARPALEIVGILAGDPEGVPRAVIPSVASAQFSVRLVPDQRIETVAEQVRRFVTDRMPEGVDYELTLTEDTGQNPYVTPEGPALEALERATARGYGAARAFRMGNAGGGPAELLSLTSGAPVLYLGIGLPEDHWHAADESVHLPTLLKGAATAAHLWTELGLELPR